MENKYDVFISYRRDGGEATAKMIYDKLHDFGYQVFFDVESLRSGLFNLKLYSVIDECTDIVVVLSPGALDRCENENDWLRREIEYALEKEKNIIPIMLRGFNFPEKLPKSIEPLPYMQGLQANLEYFDAFMGKLQSFILSPPHRRGPDWIFSKKYLMACLLIALATLMVTTGGVRLLNNYTHSDSSPASIDKPSNPSQPADPSDASNTDNSSDDVTPESSEPESDKRWLSNTLMEEVAQDITEDTGVLGSDISRKEIFSVTFLDSLDNIPDDAWDVSERQNKRVMAWTVARDNGYDLYIGGKGGIAANRDSSNLFYAYINVEQIHMNGNFHTDNVRNMFSMFYKCESLADLDISEFNTSNVTNMGWMFSRCYSLTTIDVSEFDTSKVTNMSNMFYECDNLTTLDVSGFNTSCVENMAAMFSECMNLVKLDVSKFDTSNVKDMNYMFYKCESLTALNVSGFNTSCVENMTAMFSECINLAELDVSKFDTSNVKDIHSMFYNCKSLTVLDVSGFVTSEAIDISWMFYGCSNVDELDVSRFSTSNVMNMYAMFYKCSNVTELDVSDFDTSNVTNMGWMFGYCTSLEHLDVGGFDTSNVTDTQNMFIGCDNLTDLDVSTFAPKLIENMGLSM